MGPIEYLNNEVNDYFLRVCHSDYIPTDAISKIQWKHTKCQDVEGHKLRGVLTSQGRGDGYDYGYDSITMSFTITASGGNFQRDWEHLMQTEFFKASVAECPKCTKLLESKRRLGIRQARRCY